MSHGAFDVLTAVLVGCSVLLACLNGMALIQTTQPEPLSASFRFVNGLLLGIIGSLSVALWVLL